MQFGNVYALARSALTGDRAESIRLVIWDLDDTFWRGTLTEGGIEYRQDNHDIVIELAKRGIMSSICSRNDFTTIENLLREKGIWDYFIFPSIDWTAKGARVKSIVEAMKLRASTVLFIDDAPLNRAEVEREVKGIQIADPANIDLLSHHLLAGKNDRGLTRLAQYKILERRSADIAAAGANITFLRESGIRVFVEHDVESHLDRAIELINRTNQLNFTKQRLPEDRDHARAEMRALLSATDHQAGLVRVVDRYGDYGYCGVYVQHRNLYSAKPKLLHYCFSCRTLGMAVETWLYRRLGAPDIDIRGDVLTDIFKAEETIDWISMASADPALSSFSVSDKKVPRIFIRGGCETVAISHYFEMLTDDLVAEHSFIRDGLHVRLDSSLMLRLALKKPEGAVIESLITLGYRASDFVSAFAGASTQDQVLILGFWAEGDHILYRHKHLGFEALIYLGLIPGMPSGDLLSLDTSSLPDNLRHGWVGAALSELQNNYECVGAVSPEDTKTNILNAVEQLSESSRVILIGITEKMRDGEGNLQRSHYHASYNNALRECADITDKITFVAIDDFVRNPDEQRTFANHFSRDVYFRMFLHIRAEIEKWNENRNS